MRLVALEPESMTPAIASQASRLPPAEVSRVLAQLVKRGVLVRRMDTTVRFPNNLFRHHVLSSSPEEALNDLRVFLAGSASLSTLKRLWHHAAIVGLTDDVLAQLTSSIPSSFDNAAIRKPASTVRDIANYLMSDEASGLNQALVVQFLAGAANVLDLGGLADVARKVRNFAVNNALRRGDAVSAARILVGPAATGRTYRADVELTSLMDRCAALMPPVGHEALVGQLLAERVCREVMQTGLTPFALQTVAQLEALATTVNDAELASSVERAQLHVELIRPETVTPHHRFDSARKAVFASKNYDAATDILTMESKSALTRGDLRGWEESIAEFEAYCVRIARPSELWTRELLWATDLQRRGQLQAADEKATEARAMGLSYECADHDLAFRVHRLSSHWQRLDFSEFVDETGDELAMLGRLLGDSFLGTVNDSAVDSMVGFLTQQTREHAPNLSTLPAFAITSQICWNANAERHARTLLDTLADYADDLVVVGLIPVTCFGPLDRYCAQLCALSGRKREAEKYAESATAIAHRSHCIGWEALALDDQSKILTLAGRRKEADRLRHLAAVCRAALR